MPVRLAIQASRVHNAWLCLIWIVSFFRPRAKKAMRVDTPPLQRQAAAPDHRPKILLTVPVPAGFLFPAVLPASYELRTRLTVHRLRDTEDSRRSASPSASCSGAVRPAGKW